jgi:hypothetical protein
VADLTKSQEKAFDFAQELVKQIITISSAIITLSIAFFKDFVSNAPGGARVLIAVSWIFFILAVLFGVLTLMALTGSLSENQTTIAGSNMRIPAIVHVSSFIIGLILIVIAGWWAI